MKGKKKQKVAVIIIYFKYKIWTLSGGEALRGEKCKKLDIFLKCQNFLKEMIILKKLFYYSRFLDSWIVLIDFVKFGHSLCHRSGISKMLPIISRHLTTMFK